VIRNLGKEAKAKREMGRRKSQDSLDRHELASAEKRNGGKSGERWETVKKESGFNF